LTVRVGKLRPSQVVTQWGPGGLVDLPTMSTIVAAIDEWNLNAAKRVDEPRLARRLGVDVFRRPPLFFGATGVGGVPAYIFPRFLVCPRCNRLTVYRAFEFNERRKEFICKAPNCRGKGKALAFPVRYIVACSNGHIDDFPWHRFIHGNDSNCDAELKLEDTGRTGSITDLWVKCTRHPDASRNLATAFGEGNRPNLGACSGARPWLGDHDPEGCTELPRVILRGASNAYFPVVASAISIPPWSDPIQEAIGQYVDQLAKVDSPSKLKLWLEINNAPELDEYGAEQVWEALERRRYGGDETSFGLKQEEWRAFRASSNVTDVKSQFRSRIVPVADEMRDFVQRVVLLERLREVRVLRGFTRIDSVVDVGDLVDVSAVEAKLAPIRREQKNWLPGVDLRGEGLLIELNEERIREWEMSDAVLTAQVAYSKREREWWEAREMDLAQFVPTTSRYILLHTLSHLIIRRLSLDCGYSSASLRERVYSSNKPESPMAGIVIYTATSDSDGSLGGLVEMGRPEILGPVVAAALKEARLCASDPLCADRAPSDTGSHLNGAACHACLLLSETSCEAANHYLDRNLVVPTVRNARTHFLAP
jgi:hypothetical protein